MIVLDTNVISEVMRERPDPEVRAWLRGQTRNQVWTASIVIAELVAGIDLMSPGRKQDFLRNALEDMIAEDFRGQILKVDIDIARLYGRIFSHRRMIGRPIKEMDCLIAATARANHATLATRNIADFEHCGIQLVNPWEAA
jgi:predicted nucleic acid-binding protein